MIVIKKKKMVMRIWNEVKGEWRKMKEMESHEKNVKGGGEGLCGKGICQGKWKDDAMREVKGEGKKGNQWAKEAYREEGTYSIERVRMDIQFFLTSKPPSLLRLWGCLMIYKTLWTLCFKWCFSLAMTTSSSRNMW